MDYEGKFFPDEEHPVFPPSKTAKKIKKIGKYTLYGISALVYILFMWRIFSSSDTALMEQMIFTPETRSVAAEKGKNFEVVQIYPPIFMSENGNIELKNAYYAPETGEAEFGVRYPDKVTGNSGEVYFHYVLKDTRGNEYPVVNRVRESRNNYIFERVTFGGLEFDFTDNIVNRPVDFSADYSALMNEGFYQTSSGDPDDEETIKSALLKGPVYTVYIYSSDGELKNTVFSTEFYSNDVYISDKKYEAPNEKYTSGE